MITSCRDKLDHETRTTQQPAPPGSCGLGDYVKPWREWSPQRALDIELRADCSGTGTVRRAAPDSDGKEQGEEGKHSYSLASRNRSTLKDTQPRFAVPVKITVHDLSKNYLAQPGIERKSR